ncbi:MAG: rubrerythrin family protein [Elusimicrobia bacterium HGW-Elusimicrobia-1]|jgi:rubrerythrin|nr:MAG: rubrerythrin family protein [Elusimicrobia bacterium HGW-Elusimicrobia-1]
MKPIKGSQTEKNLLKAFAGESQARNRYTYYSGAAKKEGYEHIAALFLETAENEKEHAKVFFKFLEGGDVEITASYPAGKIESAVKNLAHAADGEKMEWGTLYPEFAAVAKKEGYDEVAKAFEEIARVEAFHEKRYRALEANIKKSSVFKKAGAVKWHCRNCGYITEGAEAPKQCPACKHPQSYYELLSENY